MSFRNGKGEGLSALPCKPNSSLLKTCVDLNFLEKVSGLLQLKLNIMHQSEKYFFLKNPKW